MKKAIIWGHKHISNTFYHIMYSYHKAFKFLGYDAYWFDNNDNVSNFDFSDCIFFTEGQVDQNIPLRSDGKYILHHCKIEKYINAKCKIINLCNYVGDCEDGISFNYNGKVQKIKEFLFYDKDNNALYQPWATDLLPYEINTDLFIPFDKNKIDVNYIGTIVPYDNLLSRMQLFAKACNDNGKQLKHFQYISYEDNLKLIRESYISIDMRNDWHLQRGYIPCRIWKNISYGKFTGTNSLHAFKMLGDFIAYNENPYDLYYETENKYANLSKEKMKQAMQYIKDNHTFVNRIQNIISII